MKKKLLFIIPSLTAGGGEKSLVTLLSQLDYSRYEADLFLLQHEGLFMDFLPPEVRVLPLPDEYRHFAKPLVPSIRHFASQGRLSLAASRLLFALVSRTAGISRSEQRNWKRLARFLPTLPASYDVAIGFLEKTSNYFCVDKVQARKRIGWVHIDYDQHGMDAAFDLPYFRKLDHIVTVSEECAGILRRNFPELAAKIDVVYNIVSPAMIARMAEEPPEDLYGREEGETVILSIGRLHAQKAFETAIAACRRLIDRGHRVRWFVIGEGEERGKLEELIAKNGLAGRFVLLGLKANPYPYLKQADLYVQTSRYEGKSIAIDEAKILGKPIVVTNFSTARDQIAHGVDGLIVGMEPEAVADGIERLIGSPGLRRRFAEQLSASLLGTESEMEKLERLFA
ncbi:glycosyltransferase [Gorillibacterium sp. sgz500922]|uniref:glycosyltransferase n=1 Tax=Gorillibacterium sp. sgz500922 TaxID=3446694 RepID=UPI003F67A488